MARWLGFIVLVLLGLTVALWWSDLDPRVPGDHVGDLHTALHPWRWALQLVRITLWMTLWCVWKGALARALGVSATQRPPWDAMRPVVIGGLLGAEALIIISRVCVNA